MINLFNEADDIEIGTEPLLIFQTNKDIIKFIRAACLKMDITESRILSPSRLMEDTTPRYLLMYIVKSFSPDFDKQYNYYSLDDCTFHYFNFKTQHTYKLQEIKANDNIVSNIKKYILNHPLRKQIKKIKNNVLIPLLVHSNGEIFEGKDSITRILNRIFNKNIGVSLLRAIFLTDKFKESNKEKEELTKQMGTSVNTADNNYIKLD